MITTTTRPTRIKEGPRPARNISPLEAILNDSGVTMIPGIFAGNVGVRRSADQTGSMWLGVRKKPRWGSETTRSVREQRETRGFAAQ